VGPIAAIVACLAVIGVAAVWVVQRR
jgi:hypothetical protein